MFELLVLVLIALAIIRVISWIVMARSGRFGSLGPPFWSEEDKLFVRRTYGGWDLNWKYVLRKMGLLRSVAPGEPLSPDSPRPEEPESEEDPERR